MRLYLKRTKLGPTLGRRARDATGKGLDTVSSDGWVLYWYHRSLHFGIVKARNP